MKYWGVVWLSVLIVSLEAACGGGPAQPTGPLFVTLDAEKSVPPDRDASPPRSTRERADGALGFSHYVFEELEGEEVATLVEGPRGAQVRSSLSYLALKQLYDQGGPVPDELQMSREKLGQLVGQLDTLRQAIEEFRDMETALSLGYVLTGGDVPNMGVHLVSPARTRDGKFDPARPEMLVYAREGTGGWKLVGTGFVLPTQLVGYDHPEGFAGPLDNWHVHYSLCTSPEGTYSATRQECEAQGGDWDFSFGWMVHADVVLDNPLGVFNMWNPGVAPVVPPSVVRETRSLGYPKGDDEALRLSAITYVLDQSRLYGYTCVLHP